LLGHDNHSRTFVCIQYTKQMFGREDVAEATWYSNYFFVEQNCPLAQQLNQQPLRPFFSLKHYISA